MSIEAQRSACTEYATRNGWKIHKFYVDEARSGSSDDRAAFQEMLADAASKRPPFDMILVHKLDRFARNRYDSVKYKHILRKKGIKVLSASQPMVGSGAPEEILLESLLEGMDEFYSLNLSRESRKGMVELARRGFWVSGLAPFGFKKEPVQTDKGIRHKLAVVESEATLVRRIYDLYLGGRGVSAVAQKMNSEGLTFRGRKFSKNTVTNILRSEKFVGDSTFGKTTNRMKLPTDFKLDPITVKDTHPAIIQREDWEKVQAKLEQRGREKRAPRSEASDYLFSGISKCSLCGSKLVGWSAHNRTGKRYRYYVCGSIHRHGPTACRQPKINADIFESAVIEALRHRLTHPDVLADIISAHNDALDTAKDDSAEKIKRLKNEIAGIERRRGKLFEAIEAGAGLELADIAPRIKDLAQQKADIETQIRDIQAKLESCEIGAPADVINEWVRFFVELFEAEDFWKNKGMVQSLVVSVQVEDFSALVTYNPAVWENADLVRLGQDPDLPEGGGGGGGGGGSGGAGPRVRTLARRGSLYTLHTNTRIPAQIVRAGLALQTFRITFQGPKKKGPRGKG